MCESLRWRNRYHPIDECRNTNLYVSKIKLNLNKVVNDINAGQAADTVRIEEDNKCLN